VIASFRVKSQSSGLLMNPVSDPEELETAWIQQYARLAERFSRMLPGVGVLVEIGCGKGQLTIPLADRISRLEIVGVDRFKGPYSGNHTELLSALASRGRKIGIRVVVSDYHRWLASQRDSKYDAIISSEFLPEIDSKRTREFFAECYRVLKPCGRTVHSFLSPESRNARQTRLIEADSNPRWTKTPPEEWFSPTPKLVLEYLKSAEFKKPRIVRVRSGLVIRSKAAEELLKDWDIRESYWKSHRGVLEREGLEIPDWLIICADKSPA
jgi:cyclopropane fatty-acyl-phospholipid synthase-like methyltransferase